MKTIIYLILATFLLGVIFVAVMEPTNAERVYMGLFGVSLIFISMMMQKQIDKLPKKPPLVDYKQLYFEEHTKSIGFAKALEKISNDVDDIFESSGVIYAKNKLLVSANAELLKKIELTEKSNQYEYQQRNQLQVENRRLTAKIIEQDVLIKNQVDKINGYRGAFKKHKRGVK